MPAYIDLNYYKKALTFALSIKLAPPVIPATKSPIIINTIDNSIKEKAKILSLYFL